ncbi:hypothetical protein JHK82_046901 [Glycine max]|nr:hypothetical protein JHK87_046586 [Glycine soja]KAG5097047.1 hypothetical protein JHK82_046901 [Glycine max]KAG5101833.1 hypothetical protein JHK84_046802 [Glycine max]KHN18366.1 Putative glutamate carboxypeptidase 2 [Glycine soja]
MIFCSIGLGVEAKRDYHSLLLGCRGIWDGSTEWVEHNLINLGCKAVAYLNVDCAVQGPGFFVGSTPQLDSLIIEVTKKVASLGELQVHGILNHALSMEWTLPANRWCTRHLIISKKNGVKLDAVKRYMEQHHEVKVSSPNTRNGNNSCIS